MINQGRFKLKKSERMMFAELANGESKFPIVIVKVTLKIYGVALIFKTRVARNISGMKIKVTVTSSITAENNAANILTV